MGLFLTNSNVSCIQVTKTLPIDNKTGFAGYGSSPWANVFPNSKPGELSCTGHRQRWRISGLPHRAATFSEWQRPEQNICFLQSCHLWRRKWEELHFPQIYESEKFPSSPEKSHKGVKRGHWWSSYCVSPFHALQQPKNAYAFPGELKHVEEALENQFETKSSYMGMGVQVRSLAWSLFCCCC